ncbi:tetratricopeptide repeat protein, partial [Candidatus Poribacteria bacterium]
RALEIDEAAYGKDHPQVAIRVNNLGVALQGLGNLDGAKENFQRALEIFERRLGTDHRYTQGVRRNFERLLNSGA